MVEGSVWGGAFEMIMSSDIIVAASTSTFSMTPVNLGVPYNLVGIHNLTRDAGFHIVKELIFTASPITAQRALAVGILNHVVDAAELEDFTLQLAHTISEKAPLALLDCAGDLPQRIVVGERIASPGRQLMNIMSGGEDF